MGFTIFERKRIQTGTPGVSLSTGGRVGINQAATQILQANAVENVLLLWDEERRRIGIRPITKKDKRAYRLTQGKSSSMFSGKSFLEFIGYDMSKTRSFPAEWNEEEERFEIEIPAEYFKTKGRQRRLVSAS